MKNTTTIAVCLLFAAGLCWFAQAGDLEPPGPPAPTMQSLDEVASASQPDLCFDTVGRFVDCGNGTVKDNLTGLFWLKAADCLSGDWAEASIAAAQLADGQCGLTDGSAPGDWRLPTLDCPSGTGSVLADATGEFASIFAPSCPVPYMPDTVGTGCWSEGNPFSGVQSSLYWSSTTVASGPYYAWNASLINGLVYTADKDLPHWVWPVRGGQ